MTTYDLLLNVDSSFFTTQPKNYNVINVIKPNVDSFRYVVLFTPHTIPVGEYMSVVYDNVFQLDPKVTNIIVFTENGAEYSGDTTITTPVPFIDLESGGFYDSALQTAYNKAFSAYQVYGGYDPSYILSTYDSIGDDTTIYGDMYFMLPVVTTAAKQTVYDVSYGYVPITTLSDVILNMDTTPFTVKTAPVNKFRGFNISTLANTLNPLSCMTIAYAIDHNVGDACTLYGAHDISYAKRILEHGIPTTSDSIPNATNPYMVKVNTGKTLYKGTISNLGVKLLTRMGYYKFVPSGTGGTWVRITFTKYIHTLRDNFNAIKVCLKNGIGVMASINISPRTSTTVTSHSDCTSKILVSIIGWWNTYLIYRDHSNGGYFMANHADNVCGIVSDLYTVRYTGTGTSTTLSPYLTPERTPCISVSNNRVPMDKVVSMLNYLVANVSNLSNPTFVPTVSVSKYMSHIDICPIDKIPPNISADISGLGAQGAYQAVQYVPTEHTVFAMQ